MVRRKRSAWARWLTQNSAFAGRVRWRRIGTDWAIGRVSAQCPHFPKETLGRWLAAVEFCRQTHTGIDLLMRSGKINKLGCWDALGYHETFAQAETALALHNLHSGG